VLPLRPQASIFLHNLHFKTQGPSECYHELDLPYYKKNKGKHHSENIGTSRVDYVLYPNGIVDIHVRCTNNPFKLETEIDRMLQGVVGDLDQDQDLETQFRVYFLCGVAFLHYNLHILKAAC